LDCFEGLSHDADIAAEDAIIRIEKSEAMPPVGWRLTEAPSKAAKWVYGAREQKRADWVALLHASSGGEQAINEEEVRVVTIEPLGPASELREIGPQFSKSRLSVHRVEGVGEVELEDNSIDRVGVAGDPLVDNVDRALRPLRAGHAQLVGPKILSGRVLYRFAEHLANQSAQDFADGDRANPAILFF
jgi:hypothetical protein